HYVTSIRPNGLVEFSRTPHLDALVYNPNAAKGRMARLLFDRTRPALTGFRSPDSGSGRPSPAASKRSADPRQRLSQHGAVGDPGDARLKFTVSTRLFHDSDQPCRRAASPGCESRFAMLSCLCGQGEALIASCSLSGANKRELSAACARPDAEPPTLALPTDAGAAIWPTKVSLTGRSSDCLSCLLRWRRRRRLLALARRSIGLVPTPAEPAATTLLLPGEIGANHPILLSFGGWRTRPAGGEARYKFLGKFLLSAVTHSTFTCRHGSPNVATNNNLFAAVAVTRPRVTCSVDEPRKISFEYRESAAQFDGPDRLSDQFVADAGADAARVVRLSAV
uniref:Ig-like domain-containing protein n=1 Tax=Macrostomum lignano TaxID=282301 RepID=A0A1I8IMR2_9PLAT